MPHFHDKKAKTKGKFSLHTGTQFGLNFGEGEKGVFCKTETNILYEFQ